MTYTFFGLMLAQQRRIRLPMSTASTTWRIDDAFGNEFALDFTSEDEAISVARKHADRLGETLYVSVEGDDSENCIPVVPAKRSA